jgi:ATP-dependent Clp protease ATP-binding subunit ClpA
MAVKNPKGFTFEVRELIFEHAQAIAVEMGHRRVEPEDLLIATTRVESTGRLLAHLGIQPQDLARRLIAVASRGTKHDQTKREYSLASGRRLMQMWAEARRRGLEEVGAVDVFVALLKPPPKRFLFLFPRPRPAFWRELESAGVTEASIRRAVNEIEGAA